MTPPAIEVRRVSKAFGATAVLRDVSLDVQSGEIVALLGPSGCGKTTLLRLVAGLERPDAGAIALSGQVVADGARSKAVPPERRGVGMVFQDYALFPHMSVQANVAFGLRRASPVARDERVAEVLRQVDLADLGARYPHELSGGQQQRVALARALAPRPRVLLLDEPFSNLDGALRRRLRTELGRLLHAVDVTTVFVTHDQEEALSLADRVAVMAEGAIAQVDTPTTLYRRPATIAVARAVGEANVLPGHSDGARASCALGELGGGGPAGAVRVVVRPEQLIVDNTAADGVSGTVEACEYLGAGVRLIIRSDDLEAPLVVATSERQAVDARVTLRVDGPVAWCATD